MGAGFESQWNAAWFRARAERCFRLAAGLTQPADAKKLRALGQDFEVQAKLAEDTLFRAQHASGPETP